MRYSGVPTLSAMALSARRGPLVAEVLAVVGVEAGQVRLQVDDVLIDEVELPSWMGYLPAQPIVQGLGRHADEGRGTERTTADGTRAMACCAVIRCKDPFTGIRIAGEFFERRADRRGRIVAVALVFLSRRSSPVKGVRQRVCEISEEKVEKGPTGGAGRLIQDFVEVRTAP